MRSLWWDGRPIKHRRNKKNDISRTYTMAAADQTGKWGHTLGMVCLQRNNCVIHTWSLQRWASHNGVLYKSIVLYLYLKEALVEEDDQERPGDKYSKKTSKRWKSAGVASDWYRWKSLVQQEQNELSKYVAWRRYTNAYLNYAVHSPRCTTLHLRAASRPDETTGDWHYLPTDLTTSTTTIHNE